MDLSVIIVNYRSASFALHAVASALEQEVESEQGGAGTMEVIVIDNGSPPEDRAVLGELPKSVKLICNGVNLGYAAGVNQGIREAHGKFVCLLNPDTHLFPGALQRLLENLRHFPGVAASGPRAWWDEEKTFILPFVRLPTPKSMILERLAGLDYSVARRLCASWHRRDLAIWRSTVPMAVDMLCGACLVIRRDVLERVGGFDPRFLLYYEDADWCRRVRRHGYRLAHVPAAEIVHYYNQSAQKDPKQRLEWAARSRNYYLEKQFGRRRAALCERISGVIEHFAQGRDLALPRHLYIDLGPQREPSIFSDVEADVRREAIFEVSDHWTFAQTAACFARTPVLRFPLTIWQRLQPGRYYTRLTDLATARVERIWSWQKL